MATGRFVFAALILVGLTTVPATSRPASSKQEVLYAEEGKDASSPEKDAASKYADAIISDAASKASIRSAEKHMKEAEVADSSEKAVVAKKAAAQSLASALAYVFRGAIAKKAIVDGGAKERNEDVTAEKDMASKYADAIISDAASKAEIATADKYMKEAAAADSLEKAAIAKKAAAQSVASALAYAFRGAASKAQINRDAVDSKAQSSSLEKDAASKYATAIISEATSKAHIKAADEYMKEAAVADSPEKAAVAKKAAVLNIAAATAYANAGDKQETSASTPLSAKDGADYKA